MSKIILLLGFLTITISLSAQTREDIQICVMPVIASPEQAAFFKQNFEMEIAGAGYTIARNETYAQYLVQLEVKPNIVVYEDGTEEQAPPDEPQFLLHLSLIRSEDRVEMVAFNFPFTELEEMYAFNLFLVYEAMANVPLTRLGDIPLDDDRWRNKWIYLRTSIDFPVITYLVPLSPALFNDPGFIGSNSLPPDSFIYRKNEHTPVPGFTVGLELQFLNWMSIEPCIMIRFETIDWENFEFIPSLGFQLKFPLKPAKHFMLEPYLLGVSQINMGDMYKTLPRWAAGGGLQFGVKGGHRGAFFIDVSYIYNFGEVTTENKNYNYKYPETLSWSRFSLGIGIGFKMGFIDRPRRDNN